jgi:hypothetical protein
VTRAQTPLGAVHRVRGGSALQGAARAALVSLAGAAAGAALSAAVPVTGFFPNAGIALLACACVIVVFGAAAFALNGGDLRAVLARAGLPSGRPAR